MPRAVCVSDLSPFQRHLIGTWTNDILLRNEKGLPLSFNVMPLPQIQPPPNRALGGSQYGGFILKNFAFCETIRFAGCACDDGSGKYDPQALAAVASAPNRGGAYTQTSQAVFYDQQVKFAEGPAINQVVHIENGAWLYFGSALQMSEPYGNNPLEHWNPCSNSHLTSPLQNRSRFRTETRCSLWAMWT